MSRIIWKPGTMLYPLPPVLVTSRDKEKNFDNIITVAWTGIICTDPAMTYISLRKERCSYDIIKNSKEFVINLAPTSLVCEVDTCGVKSGRDIDKFKCLNLTKEKAQNVQVPLIKECPISIECKLEEIKELGSHDMFIAKIISVDADDKYLDSSGRFDMSKCDFLAYSDGTYYSLGMALGTFGFSVKK